MATKYLSAIPIMVAYMLVIIKAQKEYKEPTWHLYDEAARGTSKKVACAVQVEARPLQALAGKAGWPTGAGGITETTGACWAFNAADTA